MAEEILPNLFEPFRRSRCQTGAARGLGLGLYITQEIVRVHGGMIGVSSTASEGTVFDIRLPRCAVVVGKSPRPLLE